VRELPAVCGAGNGAVSEQLLESSDHIALAATETVAELDGGHGPSGTLELASELGEERIGVRGWRRVRRYVERHEVRRRLLLETQVDGLGRRRAAMLDIENEAVGVAGEKQVGV
jgi:hypothetical protein